MRELVGFVSAVTSKPSRETLQSHIRQTKKNPIIKPNQNNLLLSLLAMKDEALPAHPADQRRFMATGAEDGEYRDWTTDGQSKRSGLEKEREKKRLVL